MAGYIGRHEDLTRSDGMSGWMKDAGERLVWTFLQGSIGTLGAVQLGWVDLTGGDTWKAAAAGGLMASLSFIKSIAASRLGEDNTAQLGVETYVNKV